MHTNTSEGRQLDQRMTIVEERLAEMVEVIQGMAERMGSKLGPDVRQKLKLLLTNMKEMQSVSSTLSNRQAHVPPALASSPPATASSFHSSSAINVLPESNPARKRHVPTMQLGSPQSTPFTHSNPDDQLSPSQDSSLSALAAFSNFTSLSNVLPSSTAGSNFPSSKQLPSRQRTPSTHTNTVVHFPPPQDPSLQAIASSPNSSSSLNVIRSSTATGKSSAVSTQASPTTSTSRPRSLLEASARGDMAALFYFLVPGETVNARDKSGNTALHLAASHGHTDVACILIKNGAVADLPGNHRRMPLHCAAANGHSAMVARLVAAGASVNARDINQETPLMMAVKNRRRSVVHFLLRNGASPTTKNKEGESLLSVASAGGHVDILKDLLEMEQVFERREIARSLMVAGTAEVVRVFAAVCGRVFVSGPAGVEALVASTRGNREDVVHHFCNWA